MYHLLKVCFCPQIVLSLFFFRTRLDVVLKTNCIVFRTIKSDLISKYAFNVNKILFNLNRERQLNVFAVIIFEIAKIITDADKTRVLITNPFSSDSFLFSTKQLSDQKSKIIKRRINQDYLVSILTTDKALIINNIKHSPFSALSFGFRQNKIISIMYVPLFVEKQKLGAIIFADTHIDKFRTVLDQKSNSLINFAGILLYQLLKNEYLKNRLSLQTKEFNTLLERNRALTRYNFKLKASHLRLSYILSDITNNEALIHKLSRIRESNKNNDDIHTVDN